MVLFLRWIKDLRYISENDSVGDILGWNKSYMKGSGFEDPTNLASRFYFFASTWSPVLPVTTLLHSLPLFYLNDIFLLVDHDPEELLHIACVEEDDASNGGCHVLTHISPHKISVFREKFSSVICTGRML